MSRKISPAKLAHMFRFHSDEQLVAEWVAIPVATANRVKSGRNKGQLKWRVIRFSDRVLAEATRRGVRLPCA